MLEIFNTLENVDERSIFNEETKVKFTEVTFDYNGISGNAFIEYHRTDRNTEMPYIFRIDWNGRKYLYNRDMDIQKSNFTEEDRDFINRWINTIPVELLTVEEIGEEDRIKKEELYKYIFVGKRIKSNNEDGSRVENIDFDFRGTNGHLDEFIDDAGDFRIYKYTVSFDSQFAEWGREPNGEIVINSSFTTKNYRKYKDFLEAFIEAFGYSVPIVQVKENEFLINVDEINL